MTEHQMQVFLRDAIDAFAAQPAGESLLDLQRAGLIDSDGDVVQRHSSDARSWDAFLAIVATNATNGSAATHFRCRKPTFGKPGLAEIDIARESMLRYFKEDRRIITAVVDAHSGALREGAEVHAVEGGYLRTDANETPEDNLGELPTFVGVKSWM